MRKTLSIIIPAYNEERHLRRCLEAIAAQTVAPDEVIVVDNNSTDATADIARQFPFVTVVRESRQGRVYARDAGFDAATTDILGRIDADTVLPPNWVAYLKDFYARPRHAKAAWTGTSHYYNVRTRIFDWAQRVLSFRFNRLLLGHYTLWGSNMALPAKLWHAVRGEVCRRNDVHEDLDLAIHLHRLRYGIVYDAGCPAGTQLRHMRSERGALRAELLLWPRTLRLHHIWTWPASFVMVTGVFCLSFLPAVLERIARWRGLPPLPE